MLSVVFHLCRNAIAWHTPTYTNSGSTGVQMDTQYCWKLQVSTSPKRIQSENKKYREKWLENLNSCCCCPESFCFHSAKKSCQMTDPFMKLEKTGNRQGKKITYWQFNMLYQDRLMCFHAPGRTARTITQSRTKYFVFSSLLLLKVKKILKLNNYKQHIK